MAQTPKREINKKFQLWFISSGTRLSRHFDDSEADTAKASLHVSLPRNSLDSNKINKLLQKRYTETKLNDTTREAWIGHKSRYITYQYSQGKRTRA